MDSNIGTVALVVSQQNGSPLLVDILSDDHEIALLDQAIQQHNPDPLSFVYETRYRHIREDEEFGDYVEELICRPFLKPDLKEQGMRWLKSKIKIEEYEKCEEEARQIIAEYAYRFYTEDPKKNDFILKGPKAKVRIRVFQVPKSAIQLPQKAAA